MKRLWVLLLATGCADQSGAISLTVALRPNVRSTHLKVLATGGGRTEMTECLAIERKSSLAIAIAQGELPRGIELSVTGFTDASCTTSPSPEERAGPISIAFRPGVIVKATIELAPGKVTSELRCDDGLDDDHDGAIDCADPDCETMRCDPGTMCVSQATCVQGSCTGAPVTCDAPPACRLGGGVCVASLGCDYLPDPNGSCTDADPCTLDDCSAAGVCVSTPVSCATPPPGVCFERAGTCVTDGSCRYEVRIDATCDDGDACTSNDRCGGDGGCTGEPIICDGGFCNRGTCVPNFDFPISTVTPTQLPAAPSSATVYACGTTVIDSSDAGLITNDCNQPKPGLAIVQPSVGPEVLVLTYASLTLEGGNQLQVRGSRPVVIVSMSTLSVLGTITVSAGARECSDTTGRGANGQGNFARKTGGGGGGFGSRGGSSPNSGSEPGGAGGVDDPSLTLQGGCAGGLAYEMPATQRALPGGALQLVARTTLNLAGVVTAPGAGGRGGGLGRGGGGGASGGMLVLEAQRIIASAGALACNGGGGGEGNSAADGEPGRSDAIAAKGGDDPLAEAEGGDGAAGSQPATNGDVAVSTLITGGGGGGAGKIRLNVSALCDLGAAVVVSPKPTSNLPDAGCVR